MVIKSKIYEFLKKNLGEYLYGFQKSQLDVGLLSGHIDLVNVNFRPSKVNQLLGSLGLPITLKAGLLGKLRLKCHYTSFLSSPIEVEIDELLLVFGPITHLAREDRDLLEDDAEFLKVEPETKIRQPKSHSRVIYHDESDTPRMHSDGTPRERTPDPGKKPNSKVHSHKTSKTTAPDSINYQHPKDLDKKSGNGGDRPITMKETEANPRSILSRNIKKPPPHNNPRHYVEDPVYQEEPKKEGLMEKYFSKVLKNLVLTVKSVHIRYEDETYPYLNPYAIGLSIQKLEVKNVTQEWVYKDGKSTKRNPRKNGIVKEINLSSFAMYIYSMASVLIPTSLWEATISSEIGIFDALPAYEVRDLILMESDMLCKDHSSTFISPTNIQLSVSFYEDAPTLRVSSFVDKVQVKFTSSMSECVRNFFDYCTNVQIWPLVLRFRPYRRIPERPEKREHRKERKKRREIVRMWFQYAYAFVKTKRAAIKFMKERKKDNELFKKMEKQEKIREKVLKGQREVAAASQKLGTQKPLISGQNSKRIPGQSDLKLNDLLKGYTEKVTQMATKRRPYDGDQYFPKQIMNSEIEFSMGHFNLILKNEDYEDSMSISATNVAFIINTLADEMKTVFYAGEILTGFIENGQFVENIKINKARKVGNENFAVYIQKIYRPAEVIIPNDLYLTMNMYEVSVQLAPVMVNYTKNAVEQFFMVKQGLELDKCFRDNMSAEYIRAFVKLCRKQKIQKIVGTSFKKFAICKYAAQKIKEMQENMEVYVYDMHSDISNIMFDITVDVEGAAINLNDGSKSTVLSLNLGKTNVQVNKDKKLTRLNFLGYSIKTNNAPIAIHEFCATLSGILTKQMKQMMKFSGYENPGSIK